MWKAILLFVIIAPTLAGVCILVTLLVPSLQNDLGRWIVIAAIVGAVVAIPISFVVSKIGPFQPAA